MTIALAALLAAPSGALAAPDAGAGARPTLEVEIDGPFDVDLERGVGVGRGRVRLGLGPVRICCGRLDLRYGDDGVELATCSGDVVVAVEPARARDAVGPRASARPAAWGTAERVRYADGRVELEGRVRLWTLGGRLTGERFTYALDGGRARLVGAPTRWVPTEEPPDLPRACPASP